MPKREYSEAELERMIRDANRNSTGAPSVLSAFFAPDRREIVVTLDVGVARFPVDLLQETCLENDETLATVESTGSGVWLPGPDTGFEAQWALRGEFGNERWMNELRQRVDESFLAPLQIEPAGTEERPAKPAEWPRLSILALLDMHAFASPWRKLRTGQQALFPETTGVSSQEGIVQVLRARVDKWRGFALGPAHAASPEDPPSYAPTQPWERPVSTTTLALLQHWFRAEPHTLASGAAFKYWPHQRRAAETFIYLYEVCGVRRSEALWRLGGAVPIEPQRDPWTKVGGELATGSGKTKVMSLIVAWSTLNAIHHGHAHLGIGRHSLVVAPGLFVRDRLLLDFRPDDGSPSIFFADPVLPPAFRPLWNLKVHGPDDCPRKLDPAQAVLVVTNYHKLLTESEDTEDDLEESKSQRQMDMLFRGREPRKLEDIAAPLLESFTSSHGLLVINDEAHRVGDEPAHRKQQLKADSKQENAFGAGTAWIRALRRLNGGDEAGRLSLQIDLSATLFEEEGLESTHKTLFRHTAIQYPLAEAKTDGIIKSPVLEKLSVTRQGSNVSAIDDGAPDAFTKYRVLITSGIERWKKVRDTLRAEGDSRKPILLLLCEDKKRAQEIASVLTYGKPDVTDQDGFPPTGFTDPATGEVLFLDDDGQGGKRTTVVQVHIGEKENQNEAEWEKTRRLVHFIDRDEVPLAGRDAQGRPLLEKNPYNVVVSVLMLREGWDVRNVKVIVPLRPCGSRTLTEQVLGRGLRKMHAPRIEDDGSVEFIPEELYVIEHPSFATVLDEIKDLVDEKDPGDIAHEPEYVPIPPLVDEAQRATADVRLVRYLGQRTEAADWRARLGPGSVPALSPRLAWRDEFANIDVETSLRQAFSSEEEAGLSFTLTGEPGYRDFEAVLENAYVTPLLKELHVAFHHRTAVKGVVRSFVERDVFAPAGTARQFDADREPSAVLTALGNLGRSEVIAAVRAQLLPVLRDAMTSTGPRVIAQLGETHAKDLPGYSAVKRFVFESVVRSPFSRQALGNALEELFARLLDTGTDVTGWVYNHRKGVGYSIEYIWRDLQVPYFPDFIARARWGDVFHNFIIETKGRFEERDRAKVAAGLSHCEMLTQYDREPWHYLFLLENEGQGRADVTELNHGQGFSLLRSLRAQEGRSIIPGAGPTANLQSQGTQDVIETEVRPDEEYRSALPAYDLVPRAGSFGPSATVAPNGWVRVRTVRRLDRSMFVARVSGQSMEPGVPDGSLCLFRGFPAGVAPSPTQLDGRRVVVQLVRGGEDLGAASFTLKRLRIVSRDLEGNAKVLDLLPDNPRAETLHVDADTGQIAIVAELLEVLA